MQTNTNSTTRTRRFRTSRLAAIAGAAALLLAAAPALAGGGHNHRYAQGFRCVDLHGGEFHAGVLIINGWAYDLDTRNVKRDIVSAFRNAGYDAQIVDWRVDVCIDARRAPRVEFIAGRMDSLISCAGPTLTVKPVWADAHDHGRARGRYDHRRPAARPVAVPVSRRVYRPVSRSVYRAPSRPARPVYRPSRGRWDDRRDDRCDDGRRIDRGFRIRIGGVAARGW